MASIRNPYLNGNSSNPNKTKVFKITKSILTRGLPTKNHTYFKAICNTIKMHK